MKHLIFRSKDSGKYLVCEAKPEEFKFITELSPYIMHTEISNDILANNMLNAARIDTMLTLLNNENKSWYSGYLVDDDISFLKRETGYNVEVSTESGEYFYKLRK